MPLITLVSDSASESRPRAAVLEECAELKYQAKLEELKHLKTVPALPHILLNLQAEILELESHLDDQKHAFELNRKEIKILEKLLAELYTEVEPTRLSHEDGTPYTDDEMFEANANYEFTVTVGREIQSEIIALGRPSPAKLLNAMSNPQTLNALMQIGLVPQNTVLLEQKDIMLELTNNTFTNKDADSNSDDYSIYTEEGESDSPNNQIPLQ